MCRKFRPGNAFKFFHRDAETAFPFRHCRSAGVSRVSPHDVVKRDLRRLDLVCPDYLGRAEATVSPESDQG